MIKVMAALIAAFSLVAVNSAEAHKRHHHNTPQASINGPVCEYDNDGHTKCLYGSGPSIKASNVVLAEGVIGGRPSGCPHAYCGCSASLRIFGKIIPSLNLAANWFQFPHAMPGPGMVAVRSHHVFVIESVNGDGTVVAYDGNSGGHQTRIHTVSLQGYSVRDPHGGRIAWN